MYSFFGIHVDLNITNLNYKNLLLNELNIYSYKSENKSDSLIITDDWTDFNEQVISNNPSSHIYGKNIIYIKDKLIDVVFVFNSEKKLIKIYFKLNFAKNIIHRSIRKWLNMQFTNRIENIGQIFHESIMIPLTFFFDKLVPIHASGVLMENRSILIGGTGGVGKTTIELDLCLKEKHAFITDDIAVANIDGLIYPNYNSPKIYGYNLMGNKLLKSILLKPENLINKLHWLFHKNIFGINKVRRKISPFILYENVATKEASLDTYFILNKRNCTTVSIERLSVKKAVKMSIEVIFVEYSHFLNHLRWHSFNATCNGFDAILTNEKLEEKWTKILFKSLNDKNIYLVNIPFNISHSKFKEDINLIIKEAVFSKPFK